MDYQGNKDRRRYTVSFKLRAIHHHSLDRSFSVTARRYNITRKMIRGWVRKKVKLLELVRCRLRFRLSSRSRCQHPELEKELNAAIIHLRNDGACVSGTTIVAQARLIAQRMNVSFVGSRCWLFGLLHRELFIYN